MTNESGSIFPHRKIDEGDDEAGQRISEELSQAAAGPVISLSHDEVVIASNALNEVLNGPQAIREPEFQTRMGLSREEAQALLKKLAEL